MTYTAAQASLAADLWNLCFPGDTITHGDALDLMNGPEPEPEAQRHKRSTLQLIIAAIASAIAAGLGSGS